MKSERSDFSELPLLSLCWYIRLFFPLERLARLPLTKMARGQDRIDTRCHSLHAILPAEQHSTRLSKFTLRAEWLRYPSFTIDTATQVFSPLQPHKIAAEPCWRVTLQQQPTVQYYQVVPRPRVGAVLRREDWKLLI